MRSEKRFTHHLKQIAVIRLIEHCWAQRAEKRLSSQQVVEELVAHSGEVANPPHPATEHQCCLTEL